MMSLITGMSMNVNDNIVLIYYNTPYKKKGAMLCQQYIKSNHISSKLCFDILGGLVFFFEVVVSFCVCVCARYKHWQTISSVGKRKRKKLFLRGFKVQCIQVKLNINGLDVYWYNTFAQTCIKVFPKL